MPRETDISERGPDSALRATGETVTLTENPSSENTSVASNAQAHEAPERTRCYACRADIGRGARSCATCGCVQSNGARRAFHDAVRAEAARVRGAGRADASEAATTQQQNVRATTTPASGSRHLRRALGRHPLLAGALASAATLIIGFVIGANLVLAAPPEFRAISSERLPLRVLNTDFTMELEDGFRQKGGGPIGIATWSFANDSSLILKLAPPTPAHPAVLWQELSARDRAGLVALIGASYTRYLRKAGYPLQTTADGHAKHPVVTVQYAWPELTLARRAVDGKVYLYASPFDAPRPSPGQPGTSSAGAPSSVTGESAGQTMPPALPRTVPQSSSPARP